MRDTGKAPQPSILSITGGGDGSERDEEQKNREDMQDLVEL